MRERRGRLTLFGETNAAAGTSAAAGTNAAAGTAGEGPATEETAAEEPNAAEIAPAAGSNAAAENAGEKPGENWERGEEEAIRLRREVENRLQESRDLQREYPGFSLRREMQSPDFARLIAGGVSMRRAFETVHFSEILFGAMQCAAREAQMRALEEIRQRGMRPAENGLSPRGGTAVKKTAGEFTREERQSLIRRLERGEKVAL